MKAEIPTDDWRWPALCEKTHRYDGVFFYGVRTTGVFCKPSCASKLPRRENVSFFADAAAARSAGFRACLRCKPEDENTPTPNAVLVSGALEILQKSNGSIALADLSLKLGVGASHLQRAFKATLGVSPKQFVDHLRMENFKTQSRETDITTALYDSGFGSSRALYEKAGPDLGMTPASYRKGGKGIKIGCTFADSPLGKLLVAATDKGICSIALGEGE
ncbi:MAG TPA: Ada metal-binding domain-containing protein, partial [Abditibacteriaceae bacterium]